ncbi:MAG TPA: hypothetical protein VFO18_05105 [Methylomirabilota bacterium]|nr:hypothetical protein [Methylomirabilota bacterium]
MSEPIAKGLEPDDCMFEFVCSRCGLSELLPLIEQADGRRCRCGLPLWPLAEARGISAPDDVCGEQFLDELFGTSGRRDERPRGVEDEASEYIPLDHPHVEPRCAFCAVRQQQPSQHRLWCRVFLFRECSCGYDRR